jgi:RND family efflux transporter MFP subunit
MRNIFVGIIVAALVGAVGWRIYVKTGSNSDKSRPGGGARSAAVVAVEVAPVRTEMIRDVALFTGSLYPKSSIVVAPKVAGRLEKLMVDIGDTVKTGDLIAVLEDAEYAQQVEQARAELKVAEANMEESRRNRETEQKELQRVQELREKKIASESEMDTARARYDAQEARYKVAAAQVEQRAAAFKGAEVRLSYTRIAASWDDAAGTRIVGERFADAGAMLRSNDPIVSIIDISSLTAVVHVIERDYSKMVIGQNAAITADAFPGRVVEGTITRIAPLLKESSRQARVEMEVLNPEGFLKPGMFVVAHIEFGKHENATIVPVEALVRRDSQYGVFVADLAAKKAKFLPVTDEKSAEIVEPVLSGDVVTLGQHLLSDGASISVGAPSQQPSEPGAGGPK